MSSGLGPLYDDSGCLCILCLEWKPWAEMSRDGDSYTDVCIVCEGTL